MLTLSLPLEILNLNGQMIRKRSAQARACAACCIIAEGERLQVNSISNLWVPSIEADCFHNCICFARRNKEYAMNQCPNNI
jgi:hypothetical protein